MRRDRWFPVMLLWSTAIAGYLGRVNPATAGALLMQESSVTQAEIGRVFSAFLLGHALFQVPAGMLADQ